MFVPVLPLKKYIIFRKKMDFERFCYMKMQYTGQSYEITGYTTTEHSPLKDFIKRNFNLGLFNF